MAVGIESVFLDRQIHSGKACAWFFLAPRRTRTVDDHVRVMENTGIARSHFH